MLVKKVYYYFYSFYKFWDCISTPKFWSDTKSVISLIVLKSFLFISLMYYFDLNFSKGQLILFSLVFVIAPDLYLFVLRDDWKSYLVYYDSLPKSKNKMYKIIVGCTVALIIANFIYSLEWIDQRAKKNQTGPYSRGYIQQQQKKDSIDHAIYLKEMKDIRDGKK